MFKRKTKWIKIIGSFKELESRISLNSIHVFKAQGYDICVGRNSKGFYAIKDKCPHQGYSFKGGACSETDKFVCPIHRYGFNVHDGSGAGTAGIIYPIEERPDGVYVGVNYFSIF